MLFNKAGEHCMEKCFKSSMVLIKEWCQIWEWTGDKGGFHISLYVKILNNKFNSIAFSLKFLVKTNYLYNKLLFLKVEN